jgi:calcineurin-like phosphoesterase
LLPAEARFDHVTGGNDAFHQKSIEKLAEETRKMLKPWRQSSHFRTASKLDV